MAMSKSLAFLLLALLVISMIQTTVISSQGIGHHLDGNLQSRGRVKISQCPSRCSHRCGRAKYFERCKYYCVICCKRCLCVPPGYYGKKERCPCYNNLSPKCP